MVDSVARRASVLVALGIAASTGCGGISQRHVGDNESGAGGDVGSGGNPTGGRGGKGGVGANGGSVATGGGDDGGSTFTGGVGGSGYTGGSGAVGGSVYTGGSGAVGGSVYTGGNGAVGGSFTIGGTGGVPVGGMGTGAAPSDPYAIPWEWSGELLPEKNSFGLAGNLYFSTDCSDTEGRLPCTLGDPSLQGPDGKHGWATSSTVVCARGTAPQVVVDPNTGAPAYELQWGALLGIGMYQPGGNVFDAKAHGIVGFHFELFGVAPADLRVYVLTPETIGISHFVTIPVTASSQHKVLFAEALQGAWVTNPSALDVSRLSGIDFHVYTNTVGPRAFDFCIMNLRAIVQ
jgi:hypothetical protein